MKHISQRSLAIVLGAFGLAQAGLAASPHPMADALQPFLDHHIIAGAVTLVANRDKILDVETVGYADLASKQAMSADDIFWIASMSKSFTGTAMMMLVEEGKVNVDDPVEKYFPEFKDQKVQVGKEGSGELKKPSHPILVREILSHTSGLPKFPPSDRWKGDALPLRDHVRVYAKCALESEPGTNFDYSNLGINTAGAIVEVVSGMPFGKFLSARLFEPLGMKDTTFFPSYEQLARLAKSYRRGKGKTTLEETSIDSLTYPLDGPHRYPFPAGGLFTTAADLGKFCRMILAGGIFNGRRYLSPESIAKMTTKQTPEGVSTKYGFGWRVSLAQAGLGNIGQGFGHGGANRTYMFVDPKAGLMGIFLTQHGGGWENEEGTTVWPTFAHEAYKLIGVDTVTAKLAMPEGEER